MNYQVIRLLNREEVERTTSALATCSFTDGKLTANGPARDVKNNLQLIGSAGAAEDGHLHREIGAALQRSAELQEFAFPRRFVNPMFNRYEPGMTYGPHVDNSLMGGFNGVRTDLSLTLFLSPPSSYDGGELVLHLPSGEEAIKLDAGEAIVYPADLIHHVAPVTRGVRLAAVSWIQSAVHDERLRDLLHDLARSTALAENAGNAELSLLLGKSYHNLLRYAAES